MAISHLYPTQRPALDLNFARQKRLDSRVTFTRGSTATYVGSDGLIKTAASGEARFDHDPETGESLGLLVEEARTNLALYSGQIDQAYWNVVSGLSKTPNAAVAPDGTNTAIKLTPNSGATSNNFVLYRDFTGLSGSTTGSFYVKYAGHRYARIASYIVDLLSTTDGQYSVYVGNGWHRIYHTFTTSTVQFSLNVTAAVAGQTYTGNGVDGIYIWGAQFEAGVFPTSYIPTTTATVTRSADVASMTGTNFSSWYNVNEGTWFGFIPTISGGGRLVEVTGPGASDYSMSIRPSASSSRVGFARFNSSASNVSTTFPAKMAASYNSSSIQGAVGGTLATLLTTGSHSNSTVVNIGRMPTENSYLNGTIARLTYYPTRLTDAQLQALTL